MNEVNYQKELDRLLENEENRGKSLFLHSCCAPCSSYVLTYLSPYFPITVFYFNPNITEEPEYRHRVDEQKRLIEALNQEGETDGGRFPIAIIEGDYNPQIFFDAVSGLEHEREGGARCEACFRLRLSETARRADKEGADFFGTTLTISPLKKAKLINEIGLSLAADYEALSWLPSDFKKKEGYKRSIELSRKYDLYRQDYCGCVFSKVERKKEETAV